MTKTYLQRNTQHAAGTCGDIATVTLDKAPGQAPELQVAMAGSGSSERMQGTSHASSKTLD